VELNGFEITIVGAGLLGTSIGLRLKEQGITPKFIDLKEKNQKIASDLVKGLEGNVAHNIEAKPQLFIIATPPETIFSLISELYSPDINQTFIEISGIKSELEVELDDFSEIKQRVVMVHPMAGREISGAEAARADLFVGRSWVVVQHEDYDPARYQLGQELGELLGSAILTRTVMEHDQAITLVSQMPQLIASTLASLLAGRATELELAGQGLRDMIRIADSDSNLWSSLFIRNNSFLTKELSRYIDKLTEFKEALQGSNQSGIASIMRDGKDGKALIPGKHGGVKRDYQFVAVVIADKPGQLSSLLIEAQQSGVNIEDISIEHSPKQETGLIKLAVAKNNGEVLAQHLELAGWKSYLLD
jgi:prephenate dehydrogenase